MEWNKHTALTIISIAGVAATTVVTAILAPKAEKAIKAKMGDLATEQVKKTMSDGSVYYDTKPKELTTADKLELVKTAVPYYAPVTFLCTLTIGSIIINHRGFSKELLALSAGTSYLVANRNKLKEIVEKPEIKEIAEKFGYKDLPKKESFTHQTIEETGNGDLLVIEGYSGRIFRSSPEAVKEAEDKLSDLFMSDGYACMNDFYRFLGIELTHFGNQYGWANNPDFYDNQPLSFTNTLVSKDEQPEINSWGEDVLCIDIDYASYPMDGWLEV